MNQFLFPFAEYRLVYWSDEGEENNPSEARRRRAKEGIPIKRYPASEEFRLIPTSLLVGALFIASLFWVLPAYPEDHIRVF